MSNLDKLPEVCYANLPGSEEVIMIERGKKGYSPQREDVAPWDPRNVDFANEKLGVTKAQKEAMLNGSMFGWDIPASNPDNYDENGVFLTSKL